MEVATSKVDGENSERGSSVHILFFHSFEYSRVVWVITFYQPLKVPVLHVNFVIISKTLKGAVPALSMPLGTERVLQSTNCIVQQMFRL